MRAKVHRILVPTDFSAASSEAIEYAAALGASLGASVHVIHVLDCLISAEQPWTDAPSHAVEHHEQLYQESRQKLVADVARIRTQVDATFEVRSGRVAAEIAKAAIDYGADLVVIATHGRSGLPHMLYGSVAEEVIRHAICPVLTLCEHRTPDVPLMEWDVPKSVPAA